VKNTIILSLVSIFVFESVPAQSKAIISSQYGDSAYYEFSKDWNHYQYEDIEWQVIFNIIDLAVLPPAKALAKLTIRNRTDKEVEFNSKELKTIMITVDGKEKKFKKQTDTETFGKPNKRFRSFRERGGYTKRSCCLDKKEIDYTSQAFFGKNLKADDGTISVSFNDKTFELKMNSKWEGKILKYSPGMKKAKKAHDKKVVKEIKALLKKK
tara:strand:- start:139 stop:771 length:633 start_codon:yes stop_codon:yes gene_type:complete